MKTDEFAFLILQNEPAYAGGCFSAAPLLMPTRPGWQTRRILIHWS